MNDRNFALIVLLYLMLFLILLLFFLLMIIPGGKEALSFVFDRFSIFEIKLF